LIKLISLQKHYEVNDSSAERNILSTDDDHLEGERDCQIYAVKLRISFRDVTKFEFEFDDV